MPANNGKKGGKRIKRGKKIGNNGTDTTAKYIPTTDDDQEYVRVINLLGDCRLQVVNNDGLERIAVIRGKFKKRVWINKGDIVVVNTRAFQDDRVDVIHKYNPTEVKQLVKKGEIPRTLLSEDAQQNDDDEGVAWAMPKDDNPDGEGDEDIFQIAPQPIRPEIDDLSDSSSCDLEDL